MFYTEIKRALRRVKISKENKTQQRTMLRSTSVEIIWSIVWWAISLGELEVLIKLLLFSEWRRYVAQSKCSINGRNYY